jgi:hypothetical protein
MVTKFGDTTSRPSKIWSKVHRVCGHDVCGAVGSHSYRIRVMMTYHELLSDAQIFGCCGTVVGSMKIPRSERFPRNGPHAHRFLPEVSPRFLILWLVGEQSI